MDDVREATLKSRFRSYPILDDGDRVVGTLSRFHLLRPNRKRVVLVDHNELGQSIPGLEQAEIVEIIDHHRLADVQTGAPVYVRNEPVGSTGSHYEHVLEAAVVSPPPSSGARRGMFRHMASPNPYGAGPGPGLAHGPPRRLSLEPSSRNLLHFGGGPPTGGLYLPPSSVSVFGLTWAFRNYSGFRES